MAATQGIFLVQEHSHWLDSQQILSGKITVEVNTALGSIRREFEITAADVVAFAAQIINILTSLATTYQVDVDPFNQASFDALAAASTAAQAGWAPS